TPTPTPTPPLPTPTPTPTPPLPTPTPTPTPPLPTPTPTPTPTPPLPTPTPTPTPPLPTPTPTPTPPLPTPTPTPTPPLPTPLPTPTPPLPTPTPTPTPTPAGITVNPTSGLITTESGQTATFNVELNTLNIPPTGDVKIDLASSNTAEGTVSPQSLTFNSTNWNQPQTVTVTGVDDFAIDGDKAYTIVTSPAVSTDNRFNGLNASDVAVTNNDNDSSIPAEDSSGNTASTARVLNASSDLRNYSDSVSSNDPDYYKFTIGASNDFNLSVSGFTGDINLELLDSNQNVISTAQSSGAGSKLINRILEHGTYSIRVSSVNSAETPYNLNLSVVPRLAGVTTTGYEGPAVTNPHSNSPSSRILRGINNNLLTNNLSTSLIDSNFLDSVLFSGVGGNSNASSFVNNFLPADFSGGFDGSGNDPFHEKPASVSSAQINLDKFRATPRFSGIDGSGFSVAVLETGINLNHPFFGPDSDSNGISDRIVYNYDFADGDADASDKDGHGSNIASIIASQDPTYTGMAPGAKIIDLKIRKDTIPAGSSDEINKFPYVEQALQWVLQNADAYNIASVCMAFGSGENFPTSQPSLYGIGDELAALAAKNIIVVSSSGNRYYPYRNNPGVNYPSADPNSLSVGAVYNSDIGSFSLGGYFANKPGEDNGESVIAYTTAADRIAPFSQRNGTLTTVFAPGAPITGAGKDGDINERSTYHGASQATAHISGIAVLAQQLAQRELGRRLTPTEFADLLKSTGVTINDGDDEDDNVTHTGLNYKRVDVLALGQGIVGNHPPLLNYGPNTTPWHFKNLRVSNGRNFKYTFPTNTFTDPDPGDSLTYSATLKNGEALPYWLTFNPNTRTFQGTIPGRRNLEIKLTATDTSGATASDVILMKLSNFGAVIDGYISGATLFLDANKNGVLDAGEPSTTTDSNGEYYLDIPFETFDKNQNGEIDSSEGNLVAFGGTDTATGLPLETPVTAPPDSTVVTLLTSLVADFIDKGLAPETAQSLVKSSLAIPADVDITDFDPIGATNNNEPGGVQVLAAMVKVQNFITQTSALIDGTSSAASKDMVKAVVSSISDPIQSGTVLNLSSSAVLEAIIQQAAAKIQQIEPSFDSQKVTSIASQAATVMATANQRIDSAVSNPTGTSIPESLARLQQVALGPTTQDFKEVGAGTKTISQVVTENTGAALDRRIEAVVLPAVIATPVVSGDVDLGSNSPNAILGTNGDDILTGDSANNVLMGMRGNDSLDGSLGNDSVFGGKGSDTILGSSGDDTLFGNRGDDLLNGGLGSDSLTGGNGVDKFLLSTNSGTDTITDFEVGKDLLVLGNGLTFSQLSITQENSSTFIRLSATGEILASLNGVTASAIGVANFGSI
ncbi:MULTISPECIES: S8 family serine peptidase, partial [unclassified Microcoleus]